MKKIVFVSYTAGRDGATRVMTLLMNACVKKNWTVYFVVRDVYEAIDLDPAVNIIELGHEKNFGKTFFISWLRKFLKKEKIDIVVSFLLMPNVISLIATMGTGIKTIISERNDPSKYKFSYKVLSKVFYRFADFIVFQTTRAKSYYPKSWNYKSAIIRNPVSIKCEGTPCSKHFVSAGRLEIQKNHKMLIEAFADFHKSHSNYKMTIYGEGSLRPSLEKMIHDHSLTDSIFLPGNASDLHEKIKDAESFILSSDFEGLSNALLEAMMMGLPCISTNCAGSDEIITNGENGILIPVGDISAMRDAMCFIADNESQRAEIARKGQQSVQSLSVSNIVQQWLGIF